MRTYCNSTRNRSLANVTSNNPLRQRSICLTRAASMPSLWKVATAACTSRRTVYRHFPSKDDLVFEHPRNWILHFDEVVADENATDSGISRCVRPCDPSPALSMARLNRSTRPTRSTFKPQAFVVAAASSTTIAFSLLRSRRKGPAF
jgi:hypothetical protein